MYVEEYSSMFHYIEGPKNVIEYTSSRLHGNDEISVLEEKSAAPSQVLTNVLNTNRAFNHEEDPTDDVYYSEFKNKLWKFAANMFAEIPMKEFKNTNHTEILNEDNFYSLADDPELVDCFLAFWWRKLFKSSVWKLTWKSA